jgi:hypothetical protein
LSCRRDGIPATAKILEKSLRLLFEKRDLSLVRSYVQNQFTKISAGTISIQEMTFAKVGTVQNTIQYSTIKYSTVLGMTFAKVQNAVQYNKVQHSTGDDQLPTESNRNSFSPSHIRWIDSYFSINVLFPGGFPFF